MYIDAGSATQIPETCREPIVIIPVGSLEYHAGKLPLATDTLIADKIAEHCGKQIGETEKCIVKLPAIPYGFSHEWIPYGSTISVKPVVMIQYIEAIIDSIREVLKPGKIIIVNGHGGNTGILEAVVRERNSGDKASPVYLVDVWRIAKKYGLEYCHACGFEAKLLGILVGGVFSGVDKEVSWEPGGFRPGVRGKPRITPQELVRKTCRIMEELVWR